MEIKTSTPYHNHNEGTFDRLRELRSAAEDMSKATENAPRDSKLQTLGGLIKRVEMLQSIMYSGRSWNSLMKVYTKAKTLKNSESDDIRAIRRAINELTGALTGLEQAERVEKDDDEIHERFPVVINLSVGSSGGQQVASGDVGAMLNVSI
jgi:hypothetical protein